MRSEMKKEDFKRASATSSLDMARFSALREYDNLRLRNLIYGVDDSHLMSREDFALFVNKSTRDVDVPEIIGKKMAESSNKNKKRKTVDKKSKMKKEKKKKKMGYHDDAEFYKKYTEGVLVTVSEVTDPEHQAVIAEKRKEFVRRVMRLNKIKQEKGPAAAKAAAKEANEAERRAACLFN